MQTLIAAKQKLIIKCLKTRSDSTRYSEVGGRPVYLYFQRRNLVFKDVIVAAPLSN